VNDGDNMVGPLQLGSRDQHFYKEKLYYGHNLKNVRNGKKRIETSKMAKFEAPVIKEYVDTTV